MIPHSRDSSAPGRSTPVALLQVIKQLSRMSWTGKLHLPMTDATFLILTLNVCLYPTKPSVILITVGSISNLGLIIDPMI